MEKAILMPNLILNTKARQKRRINNDQNNRMRKLKAYCNDNNNNEIITCLR